MTFIFLLVIISTQGCLRARLNTQSEVPTASNTEQVETVSQNEITATPTKVKLTPSPTATEIIPTATSISKVTITAISGNMYIRRGPGTLYDRVGVLPKGSSAEVIGQDVLSKWVQVNIPDSDKTGWVSIMTEFSRVDGDLSQLPDFTFTEYPLAGYIKNCTEHELYVEPGGYYLYNLFTNADYLNEVQVDPGVYTIYDVSLPDEPQIQTIDVSEGETVYITVNGLGEGHKCP